MSEGVGWCPGAGEGNRTLVVSLGSFCSAIELHPHFNPLTALSGHLHNGFTAGPTAQPLPPPRARVNPQIWRAASGRAAGLSRRTGGRSGEKQSRRDIVAHRRGFGLDLVDAIFDEITDRPKADNPPVVSTEERRVGKEGVNTGR